MSIEVLYSKQFQQGFLDLNYGIIDIEMLSKIVPARDHKDPCDLLLICQSINQDIQIMTNDRKILSYTKF